MYSRNDNWKNVYFDNNFFDSQLSQVAPDNLAQKFASKGLRWCLSEKLLLELFDSIRKSNPLKQQMMSHWASLCLALWPKAQVFRNYAQIVSEELDHRKSSKFFYEAEEIVPIRDLLQELSKGQFPSNVSSAWKKAREMKDKDEQGRQQIQDLRCKGAKQLPFEQFCKEFFRSRLSNSSSQDLEEKVRELMSSFSVYPHVQTYLRGAYKLSYERTGRGHGFDLRHLVYGVDANYFVTNDNQTSTFAKQIFQGNPTVLNQNEFLALIQIGDWL